MQFVQSQGKIYYVNDEEIEKLKKTGIGRAIIKRLDELKLEKEMKSNRDLIVMVLKKRLGIEPSVEIVKKLDSINDLEKLDQLFGDSFNVGSWNELFQEKV